MEIFENQAGTPLLDVTGYEIVHIGGMFRYVSHVDKVATTGFDNRTALIESAAMFLATPGAIKRCRTRYAVLYPDGQ